MEIILRRNLEKSYGGHSSKELKSGLQKYCRRGEVLKGSLCVMEMEIFGFFESNLLQCNEQGLLENLDPKQIKFNSTALRSNLINRMVAIMAEEVGISCFWMPVEMKKLYEMYNAARLENINNSQEAKIVSYSLSMYKMLCLAPKCRLISDLKTVYNLPPFYFATVAKSDACYNLLKSQEFSKELKEAADKKYDLSAAGFISKLTKCLIYYNEQDFFFCLSACLKSVSGLGTYETRMKFDLWAMLLSIKDMNGDLLAVLSSLRFFFYKMQHKEKWYYLYQACLLVLKRNLSEKIRKDDKVKLLSGEEARLMMRRQWIPHVKFILDDYVYDHHSSKRAMAKGDKIRFALEGAFIANECKSFLNVEYRRLYIANKYLIEQISFQKEEVEVEVDLEVVCGSKRKMEVEMEDDEVEVVVKKGKMKVNAELFLSQLDKIIIGQEEVSRISCLPKAQLLTAKWKKFVNVDDHVVYKGPYDIEDKKLIRNLQVAAALSFLEVELVGGESHKYFNYYLQNGSNIYLASDRFGLTNLKDCHNEDIITYHKNEVSYDCYKRKSIVRRVCDLNQDEITPIIAFEVLDHLYLRFLLNVGDSGGHNMLYTGDNVSYKFKVQGIDFDEQCTIKNQSSRAECLFKRGSSFFEDYIGKMKIFEDDFVGPKCIVLEVMGIDVEELNRRIHFFKNLLF